MNITKLIPVLLFVLISGSCALIFEENIADEEIVINEPKDGTILTDSIVVFNWKPITYVKDYSFEIVKEPFGESTSIVFDTVLELCLFVYELDSGAYNWRVRANGWIDTSEYFVHGFEILSDEK